MNEQDKLRRFLYNLELPERPPETPLTPYEIRLFNEGAAACFRGYSKKRNPYNQQGMTGGYVWDLGYDAAENQLCGS